MNNPKNMVTTGSITLPDGTTITVGQGSAYHIGSDSYAMTVIGWTKSGKTIYVQQAKARATNNSDYYSRQSYLFTADPNAEIEIVTWRRMKYAPASRGGGSWKKKGRKTGYFTFKGYRYYRDPSF